jgi:hypothetical protein
MMGLLTAPLTLVRGPIRLTLRAWELGLSTAAEGARIGRELLDPDRGTPEPDFARRRPPPEPEPIQPDAATMAGDGPPAVPDELVPDHVDEEPVLVAEFAEPGAEDGPGPELEIDEPLERLRPR